MTTYTPPPEAVEAAARAAGMYGRVAQDGLTPEQRFERDWQDEEYRDSALGRARAALTAAGPIIERAVRGRVAREIEEGMNHNAVRNATLATAARIARGEGS